MDIRKRKQKWLEFYDKNSNLNRLIIGDYSEGMPVRPLLLRELYPERLEWSYARYMKQLEYADFIDDDSIPFASVVTGTEIFAEAFGCKVFCPTNSAPCAIPMVNNAKEAAKIKQPSVMDTSLYEIFLMADKLKEKCGTEAILSMPDVQSPMDITALIWDKNELFPAMYDEPTAIKELSQMVKNLLFEFLDLWFERYGREFIAHFPDYYMPCGMTLSEDEIGNVSCEMYREFFEKELWELSEKYGGIGIHCCADSYHQWENLNRIPGLKALNLHRPYDIVLKAYDYFSPHIAQFHPLPTEKIFEVNKIAPENMKIIFQTGGDIVKKEQARDIVNRFRRETYL